MLATKRWRQFDRLAMQVNIDLISRLQVHGGHNIIG